MGFKDWSELAEPLMLPVGGKTYTLPFVAYGDGLRLAEALEPGSRRGRRTVACNSSRPTRCPSCLLSNTPSAVSSRRRITRPGMHPQRRWCTTTTTSQSSRTTPSSSSKPSPRTRCGGRKYETADEGQQKERPLMLHAGIAANMPPQVDDPARKLRDLERQVRENASAQLLRASEVDGAPVKLTKPFYATTPWVAGFAMPAFGTNRVQASGSFPIPVGFTQVQLTLYVTTYGANSLSGYDWLQNQLEINGAYNVANLANYTLYNVPAGQVGGLLSVGTVVMTVAPGEVITYGSAPFSGGGWAAAGINATQVIVQGIFYQ